jgi:hypothetical protein
MTNFLHLAVCAIPFIGVMGCEERKPEIISIPGVIVPIEPDAQIGSNFRDAKFLNTAVKLVRANGYKCTSISSAIEFLSSRGFTLMCNNLSYSYDIADKGGRWIVTLN